MRPDERYMAAALRLAARGLGRTWPNPAVGCILVSGRGADTYVVGTGWTQPGGRPHAERMALDAAGAAARGATCYVTLEPCAHTGKSPPCADALIGAGVARVVSGTGDPNPVAGGGHDRLRAAGIAVTSGVLEREARWTAIGHILRVTENRPFVQLKMAVSRDGMIAGSGGIRVRITGDIANGWVHRMRAQADAILVGRGTVTADDPLLTCRLPGAEDHSPVRVIVDGGFRLGPDHALFKDTASAPVWLAGREDAPRDRAAALEAAGAKVIALPAAKGGSGVDLHALMAELAGRGITRLMVEGGARMAAAFISDGLCDEAVLIEGQGTIGPGGVRAFAGPAERVMAAIPAMALARERPLGDDRMRIYRRAY